MDIEAIQATPIIIALPENMLYHYDIEIPVQMDLTEINAYLALEVQQLVDGEVYFDYTTLTPAQKTLLHLENEDSDYLRLTVCKRSYVDEIQRYFKGLKLNLYAIDSEKYALQRSLRHLESFFPIMVECTALLEIFPDILRFNIYTQQTLIYQQQYHFDGQYLEAGNISTVLEPLLHRAKQFFQVSMHYQTVDYVLIAGANEALTTELCQML